MREIPLTILCCANARPALAPMGSTEDLPPGTTVMELPCSGRADEVTILRALREGAWAVMVVGCLEGNCKYVAGNYQARRQVEGARSILGELSIDPSRVEMVTVASNQHPRFVAALDALREKADRLGPVSILEGDK